MGKRGSFRLQLTLARSVPGSSLTAGRQLGGPSNIALCRLIVAIFKNHGQLIDHGHGQSTPTAAATRPNEIGGRGPRRGHHTVNPIIAIHWQPSFEAPRQKTYQRMTAQLYQRLEL